jgi:hypothetical protein
VIGVPKCCNECPDMRLVMAKNGLDSIFWGCARTVIRRGSGPLIQTVTFLPLADTAFEPPVWCPLRGAQP